MRMEFALSCLLASCVLFGSSAPASMASSSVATPIYQTVSTGRHARSAGARRIEGPVPDDEEPAADDAKDRRSRRWSAARGARQIQRADSVQSRNLHHPGEGRQANATTARLLHQPDLAREQFRSRRDQSRRCDGHRAVDADVADRMGLGDASMRGTHCRPRGSCCDVVPASTISGWWPPPTMPVRSASPTGSSSAPSCPRRPATTSTSSPGGRPRQWRGVKAKAVVYNVPRHVPCHRSEEFSSVERSDAWSRRGWSPRKSGSRSRRARRCAASRKRCAVSRKRCAVEQEALRRQQEALRRQQEALRRTKKGKPARSIVASRGRSS